MHKYKFDQQKHFDELDTKTETYLLRAQTAIANELARLVELKKIELLNIPVMEEIRTTPKNLTNYSKEIEEV